MKKNVRRGFTLPEILVTVTVIAVLAAVVVPGVVQFVNKGDAPSAMSELDAMRKGVIGFAADTRRYPGTLQQLTTSITSEATCSDTKVANCGLSSTSPYSDAEVPLWKGPYFEGSVSLSSTEDYATKALGVKFKTKLVKCGTSSNFICLQLTAPANDADLKALDKAIDGGDGSASGNLTWDPTATGSGVYKLGVVN